MEKFKSLADYLEDYLDMPSGPPEPRLEDITDPKAFCLAVLNSREFRSYIVNGLFMRDIAPAILGRVMDQGWGKPVDRVEHSGRIENITEVRRVVIHVDDRQVEESEDATEEKQILH